MPCGMCSWAQEARAAGAGPAQRTRQVARDGVQGALQRVQLAQDARRIARHVVRLRARAAPCCVLSRKYLLARGSHDMWSQHLRHYAAAPKAWTHYR